MVRYGVVTVLALLTAGVGVAQAGGKVKGVDKEIRYTGKLTADDPRDRRRNAASKAYTVKLKAGKVYQIDMKSRAFDSYLFLEDPKGRQLAEDDDSGGNLDAQIIFNCQRDGDYKIVCTAFNEQGMGDYVLTVKVRGQEQPTSNPHTVLLGKPAPDFQADFAVNGKAGKLSDLKGKVVLLEFWNVRSAPCVGILPKLRDLYKAHKEAGLEVVGLTYYNHELGHNLAFDKEAGTVKNVPKASKETEQALLKDFAAHHKIEYQLMTMPLQDALKVFDTYAVNGIPQFVLIDRQGVVRLIRVGEAASITSALDTEIKKLLDQK
jgi:peroxiredoxin